MKDWFKDWFWPDSIIEKIIAIILLILFATRFIPEFEEISYYGVSGFIIFLCAISTIAFYIYVFLKDFKKADIVESLTSPILGFLLLFMGLYWIFGITSEISSQFIISKTALFFYMFNLIFVTLVSHFIDLKMLSKRTSELPLGMEKYIPKYKTVPYFAGTIASILIYLPIFFIVYLLVMFFITGFDIFLLFQIFGLLIITIFTVILLLKRFETIFWIETVCLIFSTAFFIYFGHQVLYLLVLSTFNFMLFGISLLYNLNSIKSNYILTGFVALPMVITLVILINNIFPDTLTSVFITGIIIPFISAIVGAYFGYSLSKKETDYNYLTISEASKEFGLSKSTLYKLVRSGNVKAKKKGRQWIIEKKNLNEITISNE